ncbi:bacteriocin [Lacticaseibacillus zeae]|uniref:Bacteriocin n=1 Tax=Lacticaseibacillus zeae TaxID=57037 RepID=A0A5R8LWS1_LACZE|nr:bacteriocin [Lacticaseibacillus zeae]TLF41767.1 bacteriocin [Lacticaseibacillus zeae]
MDIKDLSLNRFNDLSKDELANVGGGLFPIVIAGGAITKGMAWGAGALAAGIGTGYLINKH